MATTISGSTGINTQDIVSDDAITANGTITANNLVVDDGGGVGPTVDIKGGGTATDLPADNEQTLFLRTRNGIVGLSTGIGFWGTFETGSDTNARRAADMRAGFNNGSGAWGNEYMTFNVGINDGANTNDSAAMTTERLRITKTAMTANVDIKDTEGNVRTPRYSSKSANFTLENEGVYIFQSGASTITLGSPPAGTIMAVYNNTGSGLTLEDGATVTSMRLSDGVGSHNNSLTIANKTLATITMIASNACVVTGTDVS